MKNKLTVVGIVIAIILGALGISQKPEITEVIKNVGVAAGPERTSPFESINGVTTYYNKQGLTVATTTVCAIKSPSATSTLESASIVFYTSSSTASTITLARASSFNATTTIIGSQIAIVAGAQATIIASTSPSASTQESKVFPPSTYFVVGMQGSGGTFSPTGSCIANFQLVN